MALVLYNTLTQKKEPFRPADPGHVKMYVCGPTVQDFAHLGHARCYTIYDVLVRHLREQGVRVSYVRNVTDVNDSIVERAKKLGEDPAALARRMEDAWQEDMRRLGQISPDVEPHVTEHMPEIRALIAKLIERGHAYVSDGDVYFRVESLPGYGKLSRRRLEDMEMGGSGRTSEEETARKEHPADFALWKKAPEGEQSWPSPWSQGRPGWHIECSAMGIKHLGEQLDFHAGGLDLLFPHHENELAQSEAALGSQPWVRHWMHHGFIEVSKEKMSKSLGNFFTVRELFDRFEPEALRLFGLTVHYRSPLNLDWTLDEQNRVTGFPGIEEVERRVEYLYSARQRLAGIGPKMIDAADGKVPPGVAGFAERLHAALDDDFNTPVALAAVWEMVKDVNELAENATRRKKKVGQRAVEEAQAALARVGRVLGLGTDAPEAFLARIRARRAQQRGVVEADVAAKIAARQAAREGKDFARADAIRDELAALGIELMDGPAGTDWRIP